MIGYDYLPTGCETAPLLVTARLPNHSEAILLQNPYDLIGSEPRCASLTQS